MLLLLGRVGYCGLDRYEPRSRIRIHGFDVSLHGQVIFVFTRLQIQKLVRVARRRSQWFERSVATISTLIFFGIGVFLRDRFMHGVDVEHAPNRSEGRSRGI